MGTAAAAGCHDGAWAVACRARCRAGRGMRASARVKDPFQGALATSDGGRQRGFRYPGGGRSRSLLFTRDVRLLRQMSPGWQIAAAGVR